MGSHGRLPLIHRHWGLTQQPRGSQCTMSDALGSPAPKRRKLPPKIRNASGYNLLHREFFRSEDACQFDDLKSKNCEVARRWKELTVEERQTYCETAKREAMGNDENEPSWHKTKAILENLKMTSEYAESHGMEMLFIVCTGANHYEGGTKLGDQFLVNNSHFASAFLGSCKSGSSVVIPQRVKYTGQRESLRSEVQEMLNSKFGLAVSNPTARVPYGSLEKDGIAVNGLPEGIAPLRAPSSYGKHDLRRLIDASAGITFVVPDGYKSRCPKRKNKTPPSQPHDYILTEHSYIQKERQSTLDPCTSSAKALNPVRTSSTTLTKLRKGDKLAKIPLGEHKKNKPSTSSVNTGAVKLLDESSRRVVGKGVIMARDEIHGHPIPHGYARVQLQKLQGNVKPPYPLPFDDDFLVVDQFCAWPLDRIVQE